jgi:hypothetical protein
MKKLVVILTLSCLILTSAVAVSQEYKQAMRYEIKGGMVSSYLSSNNYQDTGMGWGWTAGAGLFLPFFTKSFGVQVEAMYVERQATATISSDSIENLPAAKFGEYEFKSTFVEFPLMAQLAFTDDAEVRVYAMGGVSFAFNLSRKLSYVDDTTGDRVDEDLSEHTSNSSDYDIAPLFGVGLRSNRFLVELRFNLGLKSQGQQDTDYNVNRNAFLIGFSF